jgi:hypothetical protein
MATGEWWPPEMSGDSDALGRILHNVLSPETPSGPPHIHVFTAAGPVPPRLWRRVLLRCMQAWQSRR